MIDLLNIALALITAALGVFGLFAPKYTAGILDIHTGKTTMALSEVRAASGGLFVGLGLGAIVLGTPGAFMVVGLAYAGAAFGRALALILDNAPRGKAGGYFLFEASFATALIWANYAAFVAG